MTYSCCDFTDDILDALKVDLSAHDAKHPDDEVFDSPSTQADLALSEITRLQHCEAELKLLKTAPASRVDHIRLAIHLIKTARNHLRAAKADNAADYVARALKSVEGAERHAHRMEAAT